MDSSVTFLLDNLKQLVVYHVKLIADSKHELDQLKDELESMKTQLEKASKVRNKDVVLKKWEKKIREVVYEVEDTIDEYVIETAAKKANNRILPALSFIKQNKLAERVKSLRLNKVKPLFANTIADFDRLLSTPVDASLTRSEERKDKRNKDPRQDNVVGFEDETETLIGYLNEEADKLDVVSIVGMPGLGKTTVAWKIYQDSRIKYEFPTLIWVYISQEFNKRDMLLTILKKFTSSDMSTTTDADLAEKVKDKLIRGKFLIFMDDVWTSETWDEIKQVLPVKNKMGKVLITSRHEDVAWRANPSRIPHKLRFLTEDESWKLLQLELDVYGKVDVMDKGLEEIGQNIAKQCDGLPLSIIVIGGILVDKLSTPGVFLANEWRQISESVDKCLIRDDKKKLLENIISLSYTELPYDLRDCFLYLGMFPEDPEIPAWKLTKLWIAEGFIQETEHKSLEEVAQDNLKDLIHRNLVMVNKTKPDGEVKTCRVHDTIREFCENEGASHNQNLFQEVTRTKVSVFYPRVEDIGKFRRLCIHSYVHEFLLKKPKAPNARSFMCFSKAPIILQKEDITTIMNAFSLLRVLEANTIKFPIFPAKISQLLHLRYLTLSGDDFEILPDAISKLWNLQTLIVDTSTRAIQIKADLGLMRQLRHLKTKASIVLLKDGKGEGGENLQTLGRLSPQSCKDEVFDKAKNLSILGIRGDLSLLKDCECLKKLELLNKLKLVHDAFPKVASEYPLVGLPQPQTFPPNLRTLILSGTYLSWQHMDSVGKLSGLKVLKLKDNAFTGNYWDAFSGGFLRLEFLYIERTELTYWTMSSADVFPSLKNIVLKNCEKLQGIPFELKEKLEMLYMERVTSYAVKSAKKIEKAKLLMQEQQGNKRGGFKLVIAPGDQVPEL